MIRVLLNREGWQVGKDQVYRLYKEDDDLSDDFSLHL
jgi:hypothetical protein